MTRRILIVEDQEDNRRILTDLLVNAGYEVVYAVSGDEGVAKAGEQKPDLILMDIQLPGIDGYEATRLIKSDMSLSHIPIIIVTSYALTGDKQKAIEAGGDAYYAKPFSPRELLGRIREFLPDSAET